MERQRLDLWKEHEAHYEWIQREEALIKVARSKLNAEEAYLENQLKRLQDLSEGVSTPAVAGRETNTCNSLWDQLQRRTAAFESAVKQLNLRAGRWRQESDRYNAIDRIIPRP